MFKIGGIFRSPQVLEGLPKDCKPPQAPWPFFTWLLDLQDGSAVEHQTMAWESAPEIK
jgi:hypothetical protein